MSEGNKELVRRIFDEVWNRGDRSKLADYFAPEILEGISMHHAQLLDAFSDLRVTIEEPGPIAEGDHIAMRLSVAGTHDSGPFAGREPSGRKIRWESFRIFRIEGGKIAETWAMQDRLGLMEQLGAIQSSGTDMHWFAGDGD